MLPLQAEAPLKRALDLAFTLTLLSRSNMAQEIGNTPRSRSDSSVSPSSLYQHPVYTHTPHTPHRISSRRINIASTGTTSSLFEHPIQADRDASALALYECAITIDQDCSLVWKRSWTATTWLLVASRYFMLFTAVLQITPYTAQVSLIRSEPFA